MENYDASNGQDAARLSLMAQSASILGVPFSHLLEFAEGSSLEPHFLGHPAPPRSGLVSSWTTGELATLERTALVMAMPFSRLMRFAEDAAQRISPSQTVSSTSGHTILNSERYRFSSGDLAPDEDPWISVGVPSIDTGPTESDPFSSRQPVYPLQNHTTHFGEESVWPHVSHLDNGQRNRWNAAADSSQSHHQSPHQSSNAWTPSSGTGTSHLPQFTPYHSSQGSPAGLSGHRGGSYPPPLDDMLPQNFEDINLGIGVDQRFERPCTRNVAVQTDVSDFRTLHVVPAHNAVVPTASGNVASSIVPEKRPLISETGRDKVAKSKKATSKGEKSVAVTIFTSCLQCAMQQKKCNPGNPGPGCDTCAGVKNPQCGLSCVYESLQNVVLFRTTTDPSSRKPYRQLTREDVFLRPALNAMFLGSASEITIRLSQGPADMVLSVVPFDQVKALASVPSGYSSLYNHPYALRSDARLIVERFLRKNFAVYLNHYLHEQNYCLDLTVFHAAMHEIKTPTGLIPKKYGSLLPDALLFWSACRTMEGGWKFSHDQMLGLQGSLGGLASLTSAPFIDYQMSAILMDILDVMKQSLLNRLEKLARDRDPRLWFTLFFVTYILLHSYGQLAKQQARIAQRRGLQVRFPLMSLMSDLQSGSQLLLSYFYVASKGKTITEISWQEPEKYKKIAILSKEQICWMDYLSRFIKGHKMHLWFPTIPQQSLDHHYYFTGQMFTLFWKPRSPIITTIGVVDSSDYE